MKSGSMSNNTTDVVMSPASMQLHGENELDGAPGQGYPITHGLEGDNEFSDSNSNFVTKGYFEPDLPKNASFVVESDDDKTKGQTSKGDDELLESQPNLQAQGTFVIEDEEDFDRFNTKGAL